MTSLGNGIGTVKGLPISNEMAKRLRTDVGMSLAVAGRNVGTARASVHQWERGMHSAVGANRVGYLKLLHALAGFQLELTGNPEFAEARDRLAAELKPPAAA